MRGDNYGRGVVALPSVGSDLLVIGLESEVASSVLGAQRRRALVDLFLRTAGNDWSCCLAFLTRFC